MSRATSARTSRIF